MDTRWHALARVVYLAHVSYGGVIRVTALDQTLWHGTEATIQFQRTSSLASMTHFVCWKRWRTPCLPWRRPTSLQGSETSLSRSSDCSTGELG